MAEDFCYRSTKLHCFMSAQSQIILGVIAFILLQSICVLSYGMNCTGSRLEECPQHEMCKVYQNKTKVCICREGFHEYPKNKSCISQIIPVEPYSGLAIGLSSFFLIIAFTTLVAFMQYKYRILNKAGVHCQRLSNCHRGGQAYEVADDDTENLNPIA